MYLDGNSITTLTTDHFTITNFLPHCNSLNIQDGVLKEIQRSAFSGLKQLRVLKLGGNQIEMLTDGCFTGLPELKFLGMTDSPQVLNIFYIDKPLGVGRDFLYLIMCRRLKYSNHLTLFLFILIGISIIQSAKIVYTKKLLI